MIPSRWLNAVERQSVYQNPSQVDGKRSSNKQKSTLHLSLISSNFSASPAGLAFQTAIIAGVDLEGKVSSMNLT